jgi:very-short-patch-repair endonuclease
MNKPKKRKFWRGERLKKEALRHLTKSAFEKANSSAYNAACKSKDRKNLFAHMPDHVDQSGKNNPNFKWTLKKIKAIAKKYSSKGEFQKKCPSVYNAAYKRDDFDEICSHMPKKRDITGNKNPRFKSPMSTVQKSANKCERRSEFAEKYPTYYFAAHRDGDIDEICAHMKLSGITSIPETELFSIVKDVIGHATKLRDRRVKIQGKSHIKGFDIDIFIPDLNLGIEFDGTYYHSFKGLKRSRKHWPDEDIRNYHQLKDDWFATKGIRILHIKEENWKNDRATCISQIEQFLGITGFMSDIESKAA